MQTQFELSIQVQPSDIDQLGHVNNVVYLRWVQEVATAHWLQIANSALQQKYLWVVTRHEIDYKRPAFLDDLVIGRTWVGEHKGALFDRFVTLSRAGTDKILAEAKTTWCLIDAVTLKPLPITQELLHIL